MVTQKKKNGKKAEMPVEPKKLSKIGEWLKSGKSAFEIIDHKAVLK